MANSRKNLKLSEAVEKVAADVIPEATPEDFEINTVAAVSEPFADARVRNKAAREKFKKMIDAKTEQAKKDLGLDNQLKERQANGNGKLIEAFVSEEDEAKLAEAFKAARIATADSADTALSEELGSRDLYDARLYIAATNYLNSRIYEAFENTYKWYINTLVDTINESKKAPVKISLDESLFTPINENKDVEDIKKRITEKLSSEQAEALEKVLRDTRDNLDRYLWQLDADVAEQISQLKDDEREKLLGEIEKLIKNFYDKKLTESRETKVSSNKKLTEARVIVDARDYKPWQGAVNTYEKIQEAGKLDDFYDLLDEAYPSGIDEQALNDLLWFEADWIYEMLGMEVEE